MERFDIDQFLFQVFGFKDFDEYHQFFTHLLLHAVISFFCMSITPWLFLLSLAFAIYKELYNDKHWFGWDRDGVLDIVSRCLGSVLPLTTILWS